MELPILDRSCKLVSWTPKAPRFVGSELRHDDAEAIVGRPVVIMPVRILNEAHIQRCGGTLDDDGSGWCLAIAPVSCLKNMPITIEE